MKIIFIIMELKSSDDENDLLFSEVMRLGKTRDFKKTTAEHRPRIFLQYGCTSCHEDVLEQLLPILSSHTIVLISVDAACETMSKILEYLNSINDNDTKINNLSCFLINPHILCRKPVKSYFYVKHIFSDCNDLQASKMKECILHKKNKHTAQIEWVSITSSPMKASYSITLLKNIFHDVYNPHIR